MPVIINGSTGVSGADGSAATPALQGTDTNTGMFFPAADTIAFAEGGVESMRLTADGNLGLGTSSPTGRFTSFNSAATSTTQFSNILGWFSSNASNGDCSIGLSNGVNSSARIGIVGGANLYFAGDGVERMRVTTDGDVGIGTSSPLGVVGTKLDVRGSITAGQATVGRVSLEQGTATNSGYAAFWNADLSVRQGYVGFATLAGGDGLTLSADTNNAVKFQTNALERMRVTADGEVYIAGTADQGAFNLQVNGTGVWGAGAYVNGSDARLKDEIKDLPSASAIVSSLRPVTFRYKESYSKDQSVQPGFIAQELQEALAGTEYVDGVVQAGPEHLNVAYQALIPILTKALQEATAEITSLKARVAALENLQ